MISQILCKPASVTFKGIIQADKRVLVHDQLTQNKYIGIFSVLFGFYLKYINFVFAHSSLWKTLCTLHKKICTKYFYFTQIGSVLHGLRGYKQTLPQEQTVLVLSCL